MKITLSKDKKTITILCKTKEETRYVLTALEEGFRQQVEEARKVFEE